MVPEGRQHLKRQVTCFITRRGPLACLSRHEQGRCLAVKILVIHQYYLMPGQPGGSRFNEFARLWSQRGHDVTVIAGALDYATGKVPERYRRVVRA